MGTHTGLNYGTHWVELWGTHTGLNYGGTHWVDYGDTHWVEVWGHTLG